MGVGEIHRHREPRWYRVEFVRVDVRSVTTLTGGEYQFRRTIHPAPNQEKIALCEIASSTGSHNESRSDLGVGIEIEIIPTSRSDVVTGLNNRTNRNHAKSPDRIPGPYPARGEGRSELARDVEGSERTVRDNGEQNDTNTILKIGALKSRDLNNPIATGADSFAIRSLISLEKERTFEVGTIRGADEGRMMVIAEQSASDGKSITLLPEATDRATIHPNSKPSYILFQTHVGLVDVLDTRLFVPKLVDRIRVYYRQQHLNDRKAMGGSRVS